MSNEIITITEEVDTLGVSIRVSGRPRTSADLNTLNAQINPTEADKDLARDEAVSNLDYRGYYPAMHRGASEKLAAKYAFPRKTITTPKKSGGDSTRFDETVAKYVARGVAESIFTLEDARLALQEWADENPWSTTVLTGTTRASTSTKFDKDVTNKATDLLAKMEAGTLDPAALEAKIGSYVEGYVLDLDAETGFPTLTTISRGIVAMQRALMAQAL